MWNPSALELWLVIGAVIAPFVIIGIVLYILDKKDGLY